MNRKTWITDEAEVTLIQPALVACKWIRRMTRAKLKVMIFVIRCNMPCHWMITCTCVKRTWHILNPNVACLITSGCALNTTCYRAWSFTTSCLFCCCLMGSDGWMWLSRPKTKGVGLIKASSEWYMVIHMVELNRFKHEQRWQVLYLQMPSSVLGESFSRLALHTDEPVKKLEVIYFFIYFLSRHSYHKTFWQVWLGLVSGREKKKKAWRFMACAKS